MFVVEYAWLSFSDRNASYKLRPGCLLNNISYVLVGAPERREVAH